MRELHGLDRLGARMVFAGEPDYPPLLALLDDAPAAIAVLGDPVLLASRAVALVGGRNASANGQRMAENCWRRRGVWGWVNEKCRNGLMDGDEWWRMGLLWK